MQKSRNNLKPGLIKRIKNIFAENAIVLMYHRISDISPDPWELAVSPANFEEHLQVLQRNYNIIPASNLVNRYKDKSVCLTFDDGYSDNFFNAKPLLEKYQCPASFFIPTALIGKEAPFWWDQLASIFLSTVNLPHTLSLCINGADFEMEISNDTYNGQLATGQNKLTCHEASFAKRSEAYNKIWTQLQPLPYDKITALIKQIKAWAGATTTNKDDFPMTEDQLSQMINTSLFNVGIHTMTHPALSYHSFEVQQAEVVGSIEYFRHKYNKNINLMAYPYGLNNDITHAILKKHKVDIAFTTNPSLVSRSSNPLLFGRFHVKNWNGNEFEKQLHTWISDH